MKYEECKKCTFIIGVANGSDENNIKPFYYCRKHKKPINEIKKCDKH